MFPFLLALFCAYLFVFFFIILVYVITILNGLSYSTIFSLKAKLTSFFFHYKNMSPHYSSTEMSSSMVLIRGGAGIQ